MVADIQSVGLNIYLLKEDVSTYDQAIDDKKTASKHDIIVNGARIGYLYVKPNIQNPPKWLNIFKDAQDYDNFKDMYNAGTGALLLIKSGDRFYAISFGYGRSLMNTDICEERFGLLTTLNSIEPDSIRIIDKKSFDAIGKHSVESSMEEASAGEFGLDIEKDLLRGVIASPKDDELGSRMTGKDSLGIHVKLRLADLPNLLKKLYRLFKSESYKENFSWIDHIGEVKSKSLIDQLNNKLILKINSEDFENLWLAVPELIEWGRISGFKYNESSKNEMLNDIHIKSFLIHVRDSKNIKLSILKSRKVSCYDSAEQNVIYHWSVYKCLYAEIGLNNNQYILTEGKYYKVTDNYVDKIKKEFLGIPKSRVALPPFKGEKEPDYNRKVFENDRENIYLLDNINIPYGGGYSKIEFCDLLTKDKNIIHVKKYGGSRVLSHLFSQGLVSTELFHTDVDFRKELNQHIDAPAFRIKKPNEAPVATQYEIIFAILSMSKREFKMPFFSMVTLSHTVRRIKGFGYEVSLLNLHLRS